jgi:hypothetical protein
MSSNPNQDKQKRKRGRPRKDQTTKTTIATKKSKQNFDFDMEEEIVLQFPISVIENKGEINATSNSVKYHESVKYSDSVHYSDNNFTTMKDDVANNIFTINDLSNNTSSEESNDEYKNDSKKHLIDIIHGKDKLIQELNNELDGIKNTYNLTDMAGDKVHIIDIEFEDIINGEKLLFKKKPRNCLWCGVKYTSMPYVLPIRLHNKICYFDGKFCCTRCVLAYNFSLNDYQVWNRTSLVAKVYKLDTITLAPPRKTFKQYEGKIDPKDVQAHNDTEYIYYDYQMSGTTTIVEEKSKNKFNKIKFDNMKSSESQDLILKRSKPLPTNRKTLGDTWGLIKKTKKKR